MSRTREAQNTESPVRATIFFNGQIGRFGMMSDDGEELREVPFPIAFVVLDNEAHKVTGKKGLGPGAPRWKSTLAHSQRSRKLKAWLADDPDQVFSGTWGALSKTIDPLGGRYTRCIYALAGIGGKKEITCIQLHGRALYAWMEFLRRNKIDPYENVAFEIGGAEEMRGNIGNPSLVPVFTTKKISEETAAEAAEADLKLQEWFDALFANDAPLQPAPQNGQSEQSATPEPSADAFAGLEEPPAAEGDDLPF